MPSVFGGAPKWLVAWSDPLQQKFALRVLGKSLPNGKVSQAPAHRQASRKVSARLDEQFRNHETLQAVLIR